MNGSAYDELVRLRRSRGRNREDEFVDVVIVGAGPVGLFLAVQLQIRCPMISIVMLEKHAVYQRSHVLRVDKRSLATGIDARENRDAAVEDEDDE